MTGVYKYTDGVIPMLLDTQIEHVTYSLLVKVTVFPISF